MRRLAPFAFTSILCPVDFSSHARDALHYAAAVARRFDGRVTALFVNDPLLLAAASRSSSEKRILERTRQELARFVQQAIAPPSSGKGDVALVVATGNPADEILKAARRLRSDLIVIGTEGLSGFQKMFFGSTTEQVLRRVTIPVLAIPPARAPQRTETSADLMAIRQVIAPLDLVGDWQSDAVMAAHIAPAFEAGLVLLHVLAPVPVPAWLTPGGALDAQRLTAAHKALERVRTKLPRGRPVTVSVVSGDPADEIARLASDPGSLVAMSLRGGLGMWGPRRGAIAYHVLTHASAPVLALPRRRLRGRS